MLSEQRTPQFWLLVFGCFVITAVVVGILQVLPQRARRPLMLAVTFIGGLFYVLEFFIPVWKMPTPQDPEERNQGKRQIAACAGE